MRTIYQFVRSSAFEDWTLGFHNFSGNPDLELSRTRFSTDRYMDNCPFSLLIEATKSLFSE